MTNKYYLKEKKDNKTIKMLRNGLNMNIKRRKIKRIKDMKDLN